MTARLLALTALAILVGVLWVRTCSGPDPVVASVRLIEPSAAEARYRVEATVENHGQGQGETQVVFRLRDIATGRTLYEEKRIDLERGGTALVVAEMTAPRASYAPEVEANYPPR